MFKRFFKLIFYIFIIILLIRVFIPESLIYKDLIGPYTEPIFIAIIDGIMNQNQEIEYHDTTEILADEPIIEEPIIFENIDTAHNLESDNIDIEQQRITECANKIESASYVRSWYNLQKGRFFKTHITIDNFNVCKSNMNRNSLNINYVDEKSYYEELYGKLVDYDNPLLADILQNFRSIYKSQNLSYYEFAEMVITFIQNVPYTLILNKTATDAISEGGFAADYISNNKGPYVENVKYGLQSPVEFLYNRKGDCDTRTVLAYSILTYFGYDVAIIN